MQKKIHLIMPMGGTGSRFANFGFNVPKPLIEIAGKPFFYWAVQSIIKDIETEDITFVVLKQHIRNFSIDKKIKEFFLNSKIVAVDFEEVKSGPVMTCLAGVRKITDDCPVMFNDCDHMFGSKAFRNVAKKGEWTFDGALLTFESNCPQYSYIQYDRFGRKMIGTVEKKVVSNQAICGAYVFKNAELFQNMALQYLQECAYSEFFVSGVYNIMCSQGFVVETYMTDFHVPFGTPDEYTAAQDSPYFGILMN